MGVPRPTPGALDPAGRSSSIPPVTHARAAIGLALLLAVPASAQDKVQLNTIKKVQVKGGTVEISGSRKPSFTTFPMSDPPRFVIDISEAVFSGVSEDIVVPAGSRITAVKTASYGNDASAIARVVIGFDREVEPDIQTTGNNLVVKVGAGSAPLVASRAAPAAAPTGTLGATVAGGATVADATAAAGAQVVKANDAQAEALRQAEAQRQAAAQAEAARQAEAQRQAAAQAEAARQAEAQRQAAAQAEAARQAEAQRQAEARLAEQKRQEAAGAAAAALAYQKKQDAEAARAAQAKADADRQAQEQLAREAQARADAERKAQEQAAREAQARADAQRKAQEDAARRAADEQRAAEAKLAEQQRREAEATRQREAAAAAALAEEQRRAAVQARAAPKPVVVAQADTPVQAPPRGETAGGEVSSRRKTLTLVGFSPDKSRVYVRTNEPVRYTVSQADDRTVILELENTTFTRSNDRRPLDTRFFGGPVVQITPQAGSGRTVRVAVTLRDKVGYQARQDGNEVSLQFAP